MFIKINIITYYIKFQILVLRFIGRKVHYILFDNL